MIKAILSDFSGTILFLKDKDSKDGLNALHERLKDNVDYDIWDHFVLGEDILNFHKNIASQVDVYIFTTRYIQEWPPLKEKMAGIFKDVFSTARLNLLPKTDSQVYTMLADKIGVKPNEIIFIDDRVEHVAAAKEAGLVAIHFESESQSIREIKKRLI